MLTEFDSDYSPEIVYTKIIKQQTSVDFEIISSVKNEQIVLKGKRDYNDVLLVVLIIIGLFLFLIGIIIALVYYFTRPYKKIIISIESRDKGNSIISIITNGNIDNVMIHEIKTSVNSGKKHD